MAGETQKDRSDDTAADEAWIRAAGGEMAIRVRSLTSYLEKGGQVLAVRLIEDTEGLWSLWLRLADRPGELRLNMFHSDAPRTYKDVALAIASLRDDFRYYGEITLATERRSSPAS